MLACLKSFCIYFIFLVAKLTCYIRRSRIPFCVITSVNWSSWIVKICVSVLTRKASHIITYRILVAQISEFTSRRQPSTLQCPFSENRYVSCLSSFHVSVRYPQGTFLLPIDYAETIAVHCSLWFLSDLLWCNINSVYFKLSWGS